MIALAQLVPDLLGMVPLLVGDDELGFEVGVVELSLEIPVESRIDALGQLLLSAPRGRLATGFDPHHGRLRARFVREQP